MGYNQNYESVNDICEVKNIGEKHWTSGQEIWDYCLGSITS